MCHKGSLNDLPPFVLNIFILFIFSGTITNCVITEAKMKRFRNYQAKVVINQTTVTSLNHELRKSKRGKNKVKDKPPDGRPPKLNGSSTNNGMNGNNTLNAIPAVVSSTTASQTTSTVTTSMSNINGDKEPDTSSSNGGAGGSGGGGGGSKKKKKEHINSTPSGK